MHDVGALRELAVPARQVGREQTRGPLGVRKHGHGSRARELRHFAVSLHDVHAHATCSAQIRLLSNYSVRA